MSDWSLRKISDVAEVIGGGTPSSKVDEYFNGDVPWITPKDLSNHSDMYISKGDRSITEFGLSKSSAKLLPKNTVLLTSRAPIGYVAIAEREVSTNQGFKSLILKEGNDPIFFYYLLKFNVPLLEARASGSTFKEISGQVLKDTELRLPDYKTQLSIGKILRSFDEKIELNRQTNQTLEQIAQAIFKSWFVDFEPVKAKIAAKQAGATAEQIERAAMCAISGKMTEQLDQLDPHTLQQLKTTAALFPDALVDSEVGEIPEEWSLIQIQDVAKTIKGKSYKSTELESSSTALVTLKSFSRGGGYRLDGLKEYTGKYKPEQEVFAGDLVIAYTDVTQAADVIGKPAMVISDSRYEHLVISLDVAVVRPASDSLKYFLYGLAKTEQFQQHTNSHSTGTTVLHLSKIAVPEYTFSKPSDELIELYKVITQPLFQLINERIEESKNLERTRDTLLPKLLSGELSLDSMQKMANG